MSNKLKLPHPGDYLVELLEDHQMRPAHLAQATGLSDPQVSAICRGKRAVSPAVALKLGKFFGTGPLYWLNLQAHHDLEIERERVDLRPIKTVQAWQKSHPPKKGYPAEKLV